MLRPRPRNIDLSLEGGEQLALSIACPNETCAAKLGEICQP